MIFVRVSVSFRVVFALCCVLLCVLLFVMFICEFVCVSDDLYYFEFIVFMFDCEDYSFFGMFFLFGCVIVLFIDLIEISVIFVCGNFGRV